MASSWTADDMRNLGEKHARLEAENDLEGVMATLVEEPVFEFWPIGRRARGRAQVRRYYEHLLNEFVPKQVGYTLGEEWVSEKSLSQEYAMQVRRDDGEIATYHVIGILWSHQGELMGGERIWGSDECLRAMVGPLMDELEVIA